VAESFTQYRKRILDSVEGRDVMGILRATPKRLGKRIAGVDRRRLTTPPAKGKWSAAQILAHLSEIELLWGYRMRIILERDGSEIVGMDQDAWARNSRYERIDPRRAFDTFRAIRAANLEFLGNQSPRLLRRRGTHSQLGPVTISLIAALLAGHDLNHSRQIDAILEKRKPARRRQRPA
jgi:hypothetical protein